MKEIIFLRQAYKFIRKAEKNLRQKIQDEVLRIQQNPAQGERLSGKLKELYSWHFAYQGTQYRITYTVVENIIIVMIGTRENFYKKL